MANGGRKSEVFEGGMRDAGKRVPFRNLPASRLRSPTAMSYHLSPMNYELPIINHPNHPNDPNAPNDPKHLNDLNDLNYRNDPNNNLFFF